MFFEKHHSYNKRHNWAFPHTGEELYPLAVRAYEQFQEAEQRARQVIADLIVKKISHKDKRIVQADQDIQKYGELSEKCAVWAHEFSRTPEREFTLGVNDVIFFNGEPPIADAASLRQKWSFSYTGEALEPVMRKKIESLRQESYLLKNDCEERKEIEGEMRQLEILAGECARHPEKELQLDIGDVVYFDLAPLLRSDS